MLNTLRIFHELTETMDAAAAEKIAEIIGLVYEDLQNTATKEDMRQLRQVVSDLGEAQQRTSGDIRELRQALTELTKAQQRTEQRVEDLVQAQQRTEQRVEDLVQAQQRTEQRVEDLVQAQQRTEQRVEDLVQAQQHTEKALQSLATSHKDLQKQVGGLSGTVGYTLGNAAYKALPSLLKQDYDIVVTDRLKRQYVKDHQDQSIEVNIIGPATRQEKKIMIIGESKSQLSHNDVDTFLRKKVKRLRGVFPEIFLVLITHMTSGPDVEAYAKDKQIALYYSYDL